MASTSELSAHYEELLRRIGVLHEHYTLLEQQCAERRVVHDERAHEAALELAAVYLPSIEADQIARAEKITGFRGLSRRSPREAMAHEKGVLEQSVKRIEADERYQKRELLIGFKGSLTRALEEAQVNLGAPQAEVDRFEGQEGFRELIDTGYDTPSFSLSFFQATYWKLWARGDRITAALGMDDFGDDVLPAYSAAVQRRDRARSVLEEIERRVADVRDLIQTHDNALTRLPQLGHIYLDGSRKMLAEFLLAADLPLLEQWASQSGAPDRAILMALRRLAGLLAKSAMLEAAQTGLAAFCRELASRSAKVRRKQRKARRPKNRHRRWTERDFDRKFIGKSDKHLERASQIRKMLQRLDSYDDYERFRLDNPPELWWRELTGSRPPRLFGGLRAWYDRNPERRPLRDALRRDRERADRERRDRERGIARAAARVVEDIDIGYVS